MAHRFKFNDYICLGWEDFLTAQVSSSTNANRLIANRAVVAIDGQAVNVALKATPDADFFSIITSQLLLNLPFEFRSGIIYKGLLFEFPFKVVKVKNIARSSSSIFVVGVDFLPYDGVICETIETCNYSSFAHRYERELEFRQYRTKENKVFELRRGDVFSFAALFEGKL